VEDGRGTAVWVEDGGGTAIWEMAGKVNPGVGVDWLVTPAQDASRSTASSATMKETVILSISSPYFRYAPCVERWEPS